MTGTASRKASRRSSQETGASRAPWRRHARRLGLLGLLGLSGCAAQAEREAAPPEEPSSAPGGMPGGTPGGEAGRGGSTGGDRPAPGGGGGGAAGVRGPDAADGRAGEGGSAGTGSRDAAVGSADAGARAPDAALAGKGDASGISGPVDPVGGHVEDPGTEGDGSFVVGPNYGRDPDLNDRGAPKGRLFSFTMSSADSQIYRGDDASLNQKRAFSRRISVYVPAQYVDGTAAPVLVIQDGPAQLGLIQNALDNLTISKDPKRRLPPFIAIAVANGGGDGKGSQRGLEYDVMSDRYARFIDGEVFPAVVGNPAIKGAYPKIALTKNPWGRASLGCSSGGAAAFTMAWFRPDLFRRVISYSGTLVDLQDDDVPEEKQYPFGAWEYHSSLKLIENAAVKPLRFFTHVSERDGYANNPESTHYNWVMANNRTAAALKAKGYHHRFVMTRETGHCDGKAIEFTLADALVWTWRGYQAEP